MNLSLEEQELVECMLGEQVTLDNLVSKSTPEELAAMSVRHALDFRRLLGSLECVEMYLESGQVAEAHSIVKDGMDFYQHIASIRAKELQP